MSDKRSSCDERDGGRGDEGSSSSESESMRGYLDYKKK